MNKTQKISFSELADLEKNTAITWTIPELVDRVRLKFGREPVIFPAEPPPQASFIIAIGGGMLLDYAKIWHRKKLPQAKLAAIPSLWGSGAENSPVAILNTSAAKEISVGDEFLPDYRLVWEELTETIPVEMAIHGCGDTWSHALEAFLSLLARDELRKELAVLIKEMIHLPLGRDVKWFEMSAVACAAQSRSSVGLVHGIAHNLEIKLKMVFPRETIGHARLCSLYLWPVMRFNQQSSDKFTSLFQRFDLAAGQIFRIIKELYNTDDYERFLPVLREYWDEIVRDRLTRTNSVLVRPNHLEYFIQKGFL